MDLSWPHGAAVNDGVDQKCYIDGPATITLPTADYMADRILQLGQGAFLYKTDLARGYRQLRVDPTDWPLLGFQHKGRYFMDLCPPFGLRSSAMCMQRTTEAISYIHGQQGFLSKPYLDDFGGGGGGGGGGGRGDTRQGHAGAGHVTTDYGRAGGSRGCPQDTPSGTGASVAGHHLRHIGYDYGHTRGEDG